MPTHKRLASIVVAIALLVVATTSVHAQASLITLYKDGEIVWNVLSEEDNLALDIPQASQIEVKRIAEDDSAGNAKISLQKVNDKTNLIVSSEDGEQTLDVSSWQDAILEIEERPSVQRVEIGIDDGKFLLKQENVSASTDFPISVDPETARILLTTQSGDRYLAILPLEAARSVLRANTANEIDQKNIEIIETEKDLSYLIPGDKVINIFNIYKYSVPVKSYVSASTGELLAYDAPQWLKVVHFLLP